MPEPPTDTSLRGLLECLFFVHAEPLHPGEIAKVYGLDRAEVVEAIGSLMAQYAADAGRGLMIVEVAGGYQMRTRPAYGSDIRQFFKAKPQRLSQAALETLAIVAYRQPILRSDIERIRGVDCGATLRNLLDRGLVKILGKKELPGRPLIYTTTKRFLEVFNLKALSQLPTLKDLSEIEGGPPNLSLFPDEHFHDGAEGVMPIDTQEPPPSRVSDPEAHPDSEARDTWDSEGTRRDARDRPEDDDDEGTQPDPDTLLEDEEDDESFEQDDAFEDDGEDDFNTGGSPGEDELDGEDSDPDLTR